jgi:hypothetical protein
MKNFLWALLLFGFGGFLYWYFTDFETAGGTRRINSLLAVMYNLGGKWLVVGLMAGLGLIFVIAGIVSLSKKKEQAAAPSGSPGEPRE